MLARLQFISGAAHRSKEMEMQPSQAKRQPTLSPAEAEEARQAFLDGVVVTEVFPNDVPHVSGEKHVKPTGMPPESWRVL